jgi:hypothetical protein
MIFFVYFNFHEHPTINENTKNRYTTSRPLKMEFRNLKMVG